VFVLKAYKLTEAAALEDCERFLTSLGNLFKELFYRLGEPVRDIIFPYLDEVPAKTLLRRTLAAVGLSVDPEVKPPCRSLPKDFSEEELDSFRFRVDILAYAPHIFSFVYKFATGVSEKEIPECNEYQIYFANWLQALERLAFFDFPVPHTTRREVEDYMYSKLVSPRFAYALRLYSARSSFVNSYKWTVITGNPRLYAVSAQSLAHVAQISYSYVIKLIKQERFNAFKEKGGIWRIPVLEAVEFLLERPNCPQWVKELKQMAVVRVPPASFDQHEAE